MSKPSSVEQVRADSSRGIKWVGIAEVFIRGTQFLTTVVLARILMPADFGVIGIALLFTQLSFVLFDFGMSSALVQKKDVEPRHYATVFLVYVALSALFSVVVVLGSGWVAAWFDQPVLEGMLDVLVVLFVFHSLNAIPTVELMRELRFKRLSSFQTAGVFAYGVAAVGAALLNAGVWSFVYGAIAEQAVMTVLLYANTRWRPTFRFDRDAFRELFRYGGNVLATRVVGYMNANAPYLFIGRILGATQLGYYSIAYQLVEFPVQRISKNVLRVMFPAFSKLQDDMPGYRELYQQTLYYLALLTVPIFTGMALVAPDFVRVVYGEKWAPAIVPLQLLAMVGFCRSMWATASVVYLSKGFPQTELRISAGYTLFLVPALFVAAPHGVAAVAVVLAVVLLVFYLVALVRALKIIDLRLVDLWRTLRIPFSGALLMAAATLGLRWGLLGGAGHLAGLVTAIAAGVLVYAGLVLWADRGILKKAIQFLGA